MQWVTSCWEDSWRVSGRITVVQVLEGPSRDLLASSKEELLGEMVIRASLPCRDSEVMMVKNWGRVRIREQQRTDLRL